MIITSEDEYRKALALISEMFDVESRGGAFAHHGCSRAERDALLDAVEDWEAEHHPIPEPSAKEAAAFRKDQEQKP